MEVSTLLKLEQRLNSKIPIQGKVIAQSAARELAENRSDPDVIKVLVKAMGSRFPEVRTLAVQALCSLSGLQKSIDELIEYALQVNKPDEWIKIINNAGYRHSEEGRWILYLALAGRFNEASSFFIRNQKDDSIMVRVHAGEFEMGDDEENDCPRHKVYLDEYCIGVYCVTNRQYALFLNEVRPGKEDLEKWILLDSSCFVRRTENGYTAEESKIDHPVVQVSWHGAEAYARWAGCELPTEAQWEKAARGPRGLMYPWGNKWDESRCRHSKNCENETTAVVFAYPSGISGYGCYNMSGNVWEWCRDWYDENYYKNSPKKNPTGPDKGSLRVFRGGCWFFDKPKVFCGSIRSRIDPGDYCNFLGFRLVRIGP